MSRESAPRSKSDIQFGEVKLGPEYEKPENQILYVTVGLRGDVYDKLDKLTGGLADEPEVLDNEIDHLLRKALGLKP
jgi:hypothetical protein